MAELHGERELYQIFLRTRSGRPRWELLLVSIFIHVVVFVFVLPQVPINIKPRLEPKIIKVKAWSPPVEPPPRPSGRIRPARPRGVGLTGRPVTVADPIAWGAQPMDEPPPDPDPALFLLDPDAIYRLDQEESKGPAARKAPDGPPIPDLGAPALGTLEAPEIDGLLVAGFGGVSSPVLIESSRVQPRYPPAARQLRVEGKVILQAVIFKNGTVGDIQVLQTPGERLGFDDAAIDAVSRWRYRPALQNGRPVDVVSLIIVEFSLR